MCVCLSAIQVAVVYLCKGSVLSVLPFVQTVHKSSMSKYFLYFFLMNINFLLFALYCCCNDVNFPNVGFILSFYSVVCVCVLAGSPAMEILARLDGAPH